MTYHFPLYDRLKPRTEFRGGRLTDTDVLSLEEAALMASRHSGVTVTVNDFLRAGARGEITLRAIIHRTAKLELIGGGVYCNVGTPDENTAPEGAILNLPLAACQHLANVGRAQWRTLDGFEEVDGALCRYDRVHLLDTEPDFETVPKDCRVTGDHVHALADAFYDELLTSPAPALVKAESDDWQVYKPRRFGGYALPLYRLLSNAHQAGQPCPKARDVLEEWCTKKPAEVAKVLTDSIDYYDSKGNTKTANLAAIKEAITRMTKAR